MGSYANIPYKICILGKNNDVKQIIIFADQESGDPDQLFNENEREFISANSIPVTFSKQQIHKDDSISTIKHKLLYDLDYSISYYELYLFSNIQKTYNLQKIFENIAEKKDYIDKNKFKQLLINLGASDKITEAVDKNKTQFFAEDLIGIGELLQTENALYKISIGKRFRSIHDELFSANPYDILPNVKFAHKSANPLESFENQLLFNTNNGNFIDNTIYVCSAENVLEYSLENGLDEELIISLYFPLLIKQNVLDLTGLEETRDDLIKKTKKMASKRLFQTYESVDLLYDIYDSRASDLDYDTKGIDVFSLYMHPEFSHILPLDVIFKNIHSTKTIPFVKYNPGFKRENIYRFYSEDITKYGTKIPFLPARTILKLAKETGRKKQISFSIENTLGDFYIDIASNGNIHISGNNFKSPIALDQINAVIQEVANPVIEHINDFLRKNGYEIKAFSDIRHSNIEIEYLKYVSSIKIKKEIDLLKYKGCFGSVFEMDNTAVLDINKGAELRFKRVENYSEMDEEDIFIAGLHGKQMSDREIADAMSKKYGIDIEAAALRLAQFIRDHERVQGRYVKTSFKLSDSPGFLVEMKIDSYDDLFRSSVELDNSSGNIYLDYIDIIQIYIDSLLRITQQPKTTGVSGATISRICTKETKGSRILGEKFDNIVVAVGLDEATSGLDPTSDIMFADIDEYDAEEENLENSFTENEEGISAFGNLNDFENADIKEIDDIDNYESNENFELLSPIQSSNSSVGPNKEIEPELVSPNEESSEKSASSDNIMFFGEESEEGEEGEESKESKEKTGGAKKTSSLSLSLSLSNSDGSSSGTMAKKLDGMVLKENNNNLFLNRMKKRQPALFLSEDDGKYNAYATLCQASQSRQPVILTQKEKDLIDKKDKQNNSKSYNHALEYGLDKDSKHWYICPRYWCLKTNTSITEKEVQEGKCGKVIPKGAKVIPKGHYVYEFNHPIQHHKKNGEYNENTPGFLEGSLHPKGLCLPCCFKKAWDSKSQLERRNQCNKTEDESVQPKEKRPKNAKQEEYVYEIRRYPIPQKRWGFLPMAVQLLLQTDNTLSVNPDNNKYLKHDESTETLLRFGVENSAKKSFIGCIADIYAYKNKLAQIPTIESMCLIISEAITIDLFLKYHNGSLASIFKPKNYEIDLIDPTKYESSAFIGKLDMGNESHVDFIYDTIASYENFVEFIKNKDSFIDHTYLWDIVCSPNPKLFQTGCNLAILRIKEVDIRDDIEILCPTSVYSSVLYDMRKETVILLKHDAYYEPIYLFKTTIEKPANSEIAIKKDLQIQKMFLENSSIENIREVLQIIRNSIQNYCPPQSSMPRQYKFKKSLPLEKLYTLLMKYEFAVLSQVLNYQGKVIGLYIKYKEAGIVIPCFPASQLQEIPVTFMDDDSLWLDYKTTRDVLNKIHTISKGAILCKPTHKILEDGLVIGILTETNQFILLSDPTEDIYEDDIISIKDENYIIADKTISQTKLEDVERVKTIKMITLETQFFAAFRSTVRMLINQTVNKYYKQEIIEIIENPRYLYKSKLRSIDKIIRKICEKNVAFKEFDETLLLSLDEISDCFSSSADKRYCIIQTNSGQTNSGQKNSEEQQTILIPEKHLISGLNNRNIYFARIADEFIRYKRIQLFLLDPTIFLNITSTEYKINEDEMLMLESLLTSEYFKSIEPYEHGKNTKITYETANPLITQTYTNEISQEQQKRMILKDTAKEDLQNKMGIECVQIVYNITGNAKSEWKSFFPKNSTESQLHKSVKCSFYPIIYVYNEVYKTTMTVEQVKEKLVVEYAKYMDSYQEKIFAILRTQGKRDMIDDIRKGKYSFETAIASEVYFLTTLDMWVLSSALKLPIILFHQNKLKHLLETVNWLKLSNDKFTQYYFVRIATEPDYPSNFLSQYTIVKPPLKMTSVDMVKKMADATPDNSISIENYFTRGK